MGLKIRKRTEYKKIQLKELASGYNLKKNFMREFMSIYGYKLGIKKLDTIIQETVFLSLILIKTYFVF